jgi:hypothetical protein
VEIRWQGADLDRLIDRVHAHVQEAAARRLTSRGWVLRAEVSFNHCGDRGSCDLVAWSARTRTLLVVEAKSRLGNLQDVLHRLDVKVRLGRQLATQLGWPEPSVVVGALAIAEARTARRILAQHATLFSGFDIRGRAAAAWLRAPAGPVRGLLWFETLPNSDDGRTTTADRVRLASRAG